MALHRIEDPATAGTGAAPIIADRVLYTNADGTKLVEEGSEDAATLVASHPGKPIPADLAASLDLEVDKDGKVKQRAAGKDKQRGAGKDKAADREATPPKDDGREADPVVAAGASALEAMSKTQLKAVAKDRGVPGYTKMNDAELRAALAEGGAMQAGGTTPG